VREEGLESHVDIEFQVTSAIPLGPSGKVIRVKNEYIQKKATQTEASVPEGAGI
jgi:hypothetical protein